MRIRCGIGILMVHLYAIRSDLAPFDGCSSVFLCNQGLFHVDTADIRECNCNKWVNVGLNLFDSNSTVAQNLKTILITSPSWANPWWRHEKEIFPRYWSFVRGIHRSPVKSPHKGQWRGALMFSLICPWRDGWANNRDAGNLRCHRAHYSVTLMA